MYVLLIEQNDLSQTESLLAGLQEKGHQVGVVHTPVAAATQAAKLWPNLIILNGTSAGFKEFLHALDETQLNIPRLMVNSQEDVHLELPDKAQLVLPDRLTHLDQKIENAVAAQKNRFLRLPGLVIDFEHRQVLRNEQQFSLTPKEFKLLQLLVENSNQVMSRKKIMQEVWETDYMGDTRTLDVHIRWLREKIEENPSRPERLITIRGVGYRFIRTELETE